MRSTRNTDDSDEAFPDESLDSQSGLAETDLEGIISTLTEMVSQAKSVPLSSSVLVSKEDVLEMLDLARVRIPQELKRAQWMLRERQEFLDRVQLEADEILESARAMAERLVAKTEIVRQANMTASHLIQSAKEDASKLKLEAQDYADQRLASLEIVLERTLKTVRSGRNRLMPPLNDPDVEDSIGRVSKSSVVGSPEIDAFFDQDTKLGRSDVDG